MLSIFDPIREFTFLSVALRILFVSLSAGLIGSERGRGGRAAGLRTHILVALGSCIAIIVDQYLVAAVSPTAEPARLGAQVINGIGFLGAGTILVTGRRVTGLTTAAGLWTTACVGLAYGSGYFEGGLLVTIAMFIVVSILHKLEGMTSALTAMELLIELEKSEDIPCLLESARVCNTRVVNINIEDNQDEGHKGPLRIHLSLKVGRTFDSAVLLNELSHRIPVLLFKEL